MTLFIIMVPLMLLATAIAAVPVLYLSVREHNLIHHGASRKPKPTRPMDGVGPVRVSGSPGAEAYPRAA
jgi:hypothetical protein